MANAVVGICIVQFHLPGIGSLKAKRSIIKSILAKSRNAFNVSSAEVDYQDTWQSALLAFTTVSSSATHTRKILQSLIEWIETNYPDEIIVDHNIELC